VIEEINDENNYFGMQNFCCLNIAILRMIIYQNSNEIVYCEKIFLSENSSSPHFQYMPRCYSCILIRKSRTFEEGNAPALYHVR